MRFLGSAKHDNSNLLTPNMTNRFRMVCKATMQWVILLVLRILSFVHITGAILRRGHPFHQDLLPLTKHLGGRELIIAPCHSILLWGLAGLTRQPGPGKAGRAPRLRYH